MGTDALRRAPSVVSVSALSSPKMPLNKANAVTNKRGRLGARAAVTSVPVATKSVVIVLVIHRLWYRVHMKNTEMKLGSKRYMLV